MPHGKRLIIGLGNPGAEYEGTRHNVGFRVIDALADEKAIRLAHDQDALVGWGRHRGMELGLAKPLTYVNRSGGAAARLLRAHDLSAADLLVVVDDLHLDVGDMRLRLGGSSGGHNGLENVTERLGTDTYARLRLGVGRDFARGEMVDYVLAPFPRSEASLVEEAVFRACQAALIVAADGIEAAMNRFN